jgi:hypothetical protein
MTLKQVLLLASPEAIKGAVIARVGIAIVF